jgi:4-hydroxythreonine-4-phosphate dehydrogenase
VAATIRLAVSCGDPAGIGPEVTLQAIATGGLDATVLLVGPATVWARAADVAGLPWPDLSGALLVSAGEGSAPPFGAPSAETGATALAALESATTLVETGEAAALVTAPISKEAVAAAGSAHRGHTDWLDARFPDHRAVMAFVGGGLRVALVTAHVPLSEVPGLVTAQAVEQTIRVCAGDLEGRFGFVSPRIGVCGLNPHAGEGGLLGPEDASQVAPGIAAAQARGIDARGPLPGDTAFARALAGEFDAVVACYHDQGLAPIKARALHAAVNVTLGLPIVRTSVAHGTAFDLAWQGRAESSGMVEALRVAAILRHQRK